MSPPRGSARLAHRVTAKDTAAMWGNELDVLATPVLLGLAELACMRAIEPLPPGQMTVGVGFDIEHLAPTPSGWNVTFEATLRGIDGRRLVFDVNAHDGVDVVLRGTHTRAVVDRQKFLSRVAAKTAANPNPPHGD